MNLIVDPCGCLSVVVNPVSGKFATIRVANSCYREHLGIPNKFIKVNKIEEKYSEIKSITISLWP